MRKRIGIYGASDEALALIPLLSANPSVEIAAIVDADALRLLDRLPHLDPGVAALLEQTLGNDPAGAARRRVTARGDRRERGAPVRGALPGRARARPPGGVAAHGAPALGLGVPSQDAKIELLQALHEVVESYNLTIDPDELFVRMLEIAIGVTGAEGGSLMLADETRRELSVRVAVGVERELWPKIRVPLGDGIAGRVAAEGRPLRLRGKADRQRFRIARERLDVDSALSVPLLQDGRVLGALNLHHRTRTDAFSQDDLTFTEELARLLAQIIARSQEHNVLRVLGSVRVLLIAGTSEPVATLSVQINQLETACPTITKLLPTFLSRIRPVSRARAAASNFSVTEGIMGLPLLTYHVLRFRRRGLQRSRLPQ